MSFARSCVVCSTWVPCVTQMLHHILGRKHRAFLEESGSEEEQLTRKLQYILDKYVVSDPVLGLEHVVETPGLPGHFTYTCLMCHTAGDCKKMFSHLFNPEHNHNYIETYHPEMSVDPGAYPYLKRYYSAVFHVASAIEKKHGRQKIREEKAGFNCTESLLPKTAKPLILPPKDPPGAEPSGETKRPRRTLKSRVPRDDEGGGPGKARPDYVPLRKRPENQFPPNSERQFPGEKRIPDYRTAPEGRPPPDKGWDGETPPPQGHNRVMIREERVVYGQREVPLHLPPPNRGHKNMHNEFMATEELLFRSNKDFLDYLNNFEIEDDEDASYIRRILLNCTDALCSFQEELSMPERPPVPRHQMPRAERTRDVVGNLFGIRSGFGSTRVDAQKSTLTDAQKAAAFVARNAALNVVQNVTQQKAALGVGQNPPLGVAQRPPLGVAQRPPLGVAQRPPLGVGQRPPLGVGQHPPLGVAQKTSLDVAKNNTLGAAQNPASGATQNPAPGAAQNPAPGAAQNPPVSAAQNPPVSAAQNPPVSAAQNPPVSAAQNPVLSAPWNPALGVPRNPALGAPWNPALGAPRNPAFGDPRNPAFGDPRNPAFGDPRNPAFGDPRNPAFGDPRNPAFGDPRNPAFGDPRNPAFGDPRNPALGAPLNPDPFSRPDFNSNPLPARPSAPQVPQIPATEMLSGIIEMSESEVLAVFRDIVASNPAFQGIPIPSVIQYLKAKGKLKKS